MKSSSPLWRPIRVKFVSKGPPPRNSNVWLRQFPHMAGVWGNCQFIFDINATRYDWLVVNDDLPCLKDERHSTRSERLNCHRENTLLVTTEPITVKSYSKTFLSQFGHVLSSQESEFIDHPNAIFSQAGLHWFYGIGKNHMFTYDQMKAAQPPKKDRLISTVCSSKRQKHTLHNRRYAFTMKLKSVMPELDHFGHGVNLIDDKAEALDPYRYHVAIENHICLHHWTEKLADPFLGCNLPIYCGCPNLSDYFPQESFISIDLFDFEKSLDVIERAIANKEYDKRLPAIIEARRLVMDKYNLFAILARIIETRHISSPANAGETIHSRRATRMRHPMAHLSQFANRFFQLQSMQRK